MTPEMLTRQANIVTALSAATAAVQTRDRSNSEWISWDTWLTSLASDWSAPDSLDTFLSGKC